MRKIVIALSLQGLFLISPPAQSDYSVDVVHYACRPETQRMEIWYEQLVNEKGDFFDRELEGAYNPSELIQWNEANYRQSKPSEKSPIKKICKVGEHNIRLEIHPGAICQDGALPKIKIFSKENMLYESKAFGTSCSSAAGVGPEVVRKIVVTPGQVEIESGFWFW